MKIQVEISGILRKPQGLARQHLELAEGARSVDLLAALGYSAAEQRALRVSRQGEILSPTQLLAGGDELIVFAALGGG